MLDGSAQDLVIRGEVVHGRKLGRTIGFPTANIALGEVDLPRFGVYAVRTRLPDGRHLPGVANVGVNPTVGEVAPVLEVYLFDFDEDIYGQTLAVELVEFIRAERRFSGVAELCHAIRQDVSAAELILSFGANGAPVRATAGRGC